MARAPPSPPRPRVRGAPGGGVPGAALLLALAGRAPRPTVGPPEWSPADVVAYRLLTKNDFQAGSSSHVWGNIAHGAEICTRIVPAAGSEPTGAFRAVMNRRCSFWNETMGPLTTLGGLAGASVVP